jgi:hypothetical protein
MAVDQRVLAARARKSDESLLYLALSAPERMSQVLKSRDLVHRALNQRSNGQPGSDAIHAFEVALTMLVAALDITAVIAHRVVLNGTERHAGWQNPSWIARLPQSLANLAADGTPARHALTVVQHLRNSIHGVALQGSGVSSGANAPRVLMGLPQAVGDLVIPPFDGVSIT